MNINTKPVTEMSMLELEQERDQIHEYLMTASVEELRCDPRRLDVLARAKQLIAQAKVLTQALRNA